MPTQTDLPPNIVAQIILGEAAGEGPEGIEAVADTILNRSRKSKKSLEDIATAPAQFSAYARPDLEFFYTKQLVALQQLAEALVEERRAKEFMPTHPYQHYVTSDLWEKRGTLNPKHWLNKMQVMKQIGNHVFLEEAKP